MPARKRRAPLPDRMPYALRARRRRVASPATLLMLVLVLAGLLIVLL